MGPDKQQQCQLGLPVTSTFPWRWKAKDGAILFGLCMRHPLILPSFSSNSEDYRPGCAEKLTTSLSIAWRNRGLLGFHFSR